jgi:hypothetical protein
MIEPDRAADLANTNLCSEHGEAIERFGGEFKVLSQGENLSKPGSLKRNPGGVRTKLVRNMRALDQLREEIEKQRNGTV